MKPRSQIVRLLFTLVVALSGAGSLHAEPSTQNQERIAVLTEMTDVLRESGTTHFLSVAGRREWAVPKLFSEWYISWLPDDSEGLKDVEQAKNGFGLELARQLTRTAKTVRETKESQKLEHAADLLFRVADWVGGEVGYANMLLQNRVYDIASVAATKLVADLSYPFDKAEAVAKRFDWSWASEENRRAVLFEESGGAHFAPGDEDDAGTRLRNEWRRGVTAALNQGPTNRRADFDIFLIDDFQPGEDVGLPETSWTRKAHFMIGEGNFGSVNLRNLEALSEFRRRHGDFPTKPVTYVKGEDEGDIQAAFWELCWENPSGVGAAYIVYEDYLTGSLADEGHRAKAAADKEAEGAPD